MHWGWYWKVKKNYTPKPLCSWYSYSEIDSFKMFKNKELVSLVRATADRISFTIPKYDLIATLDYDNSLRVNFIGGSYIIPVEAKPCNYGGFYYFFRCPQCLIRMRKLYCVEGKYCCRKCARLGYYSQRLRPSERNLMMGNKVQSILMGRGGDINNKPPLMQHVTFESLKSKYLRYDRKWHCATNQELITWYGPKAEKYLEPYQFVTDFL